MDYFPQWILTVRGVIVAVLPLISFAVTLATWVIAVKLRREAKRQADLAAEPIAIHLTCDDGKRFFTLPYSPRRQQLNRAELLGVLGMYANGGRFSLSRLSEEFTGGHFEEVLAGKYSCIDLWCSQDEFALFQKDGAK